MGCCHDSKMMILESIKDVLYLIQQEEEDLKKIIEKISEDKKNNPIDNANKIHGINVIQSGLSLLCIFLYEMDHENIFDSEEELEFCKSIEQAIFQKYKQLKDNQFPNNVRLNYYKLIITLITLIYFTLLTNNIGKQDILP